MYSLLFWIIISIIFFDFLFETFLEYLNLKNMKETLPEALKGIYDNDKYAQSQQYEKVKVRFSLISGSVSFVVILLIMFFGIFGMLDTVVSDISSNQYLRTLMFFGILGLAGDILSTPFQVYSTFIIEEKFGFNKTTVRTFITDKLKSWLLGAIIGGGLLMFIIWAFNEAGNWFLVIVMAGIAAFSIFMNMFYTTLIVPLFNKQTPLQDGSLKEKLLNFGEKAGFKIENVFVIDGSKRSTKANAYFSGLGPKKRIVLYDTLIDDLEEDEVVAVLAHEIGHYKYKHVYLGLVLSLIQTGIMIWLLSVFVTLPELSFAMGANQQSFYMGLLAFGLLYSPVSTVTGLMGNILSRKNEYQADDFAKKFGFGKQLIKGLIKLSVKNLSNLTPHWFYVFIVYSHPTLLQRKAMIEKD